MVSSLQTGTGARLDGSRLAYVSDYLSFTGQDEHGRVAFAVDTNRGRDGDGFQADGGQRW